ncbi:MAG: alkaline phosphatase D family protein [Chitinophagales bacterium]
MRKIIFIFILFCLFHSKAYSQSIIAGPIVGAVTDTSASIIILSNQPLSGIFIIKENNVTIYANSFFYSLNNLEDRLIKFDVSGFNSNTKYNYYLKIRNKADTITGSFKTFPKENISTNFSFTFGSCTENFKNDSVFVAMQKESPDFFVHLGDWTYPDHEEYPEVPTHNAHRFFVADPKEIEESFVIRYNLPNLKKLLQTTPVDYVFDDEDGVWDDFSKHTYCDLHIKNGLTTINEIPFPDSLRTNLLESYHQYFPAYINSEQPKEAYHSFMYGNTEFFFIDTRSTRSPNSESFKPAKKGKWKYKVAKGHNILDSTQLNWLLNGLKNSKADWKIILSGTSFNKSYKKIIDICMLKAAQNRKLPNGMTGAYVAASMSAMWFSFPETQGKLINFCRENKIKNVMICSGDVHTSGIDNGKNAGFPELMSANLAQENTKLASIVTNDLKMKLWNEGGQGIHNNNFLDAFGKVEVFGKDSIRMSCIDKDDHLICSYTLKDGFLPKKYNIKRNSKITFGDRIRAVFKLLRIGFSRLTK